MNWFLPSGVGRPCRVYIIKFGNLKVLLKGRRSLLSHVGRRVGRMVRGVWLAIPGEGDSVVAV